MSTLNQGESESPLQTVWKGFRILDPENTCVPGVCRHCGVSLTETTSRRGEFELANVCCVPCGAAGTARLKLQAVEQRVFAQLQFIPADMWVWDPKLGNAEYLQKAFNAVSVEEKRGLIIHGKTGTWKTRIMVQLLIELLRAEVTCLWLDKASAIEHGMPREAYSCSVLFIDDLGSESKGTRFELQLAQVLEHRLNNQKVVVLNTKLTAREFKQRFILGSAAESIVRLLQERCYNLDVTK